MTNVDLNPRWFSFAAMKKVGYFITTLVLFIFFSVKNYAQVIWSNPEAESAYKDGKTKLSQGEFPAAIVAFRQALVLEPRVNVTRIGLAEAQMLNGANADAIATLQPLFDQHIADEHSYIISAMAHKETEGLKKAIKVLDDGLDQYPSSGVIRYELGTFYIEKGDAEAALKTWVKGINMNPNFHPNYYEAAYSYTYTIRPVWSILYTEVFLNVENQTLRAADTRKILTDAYRKFFFARDV